MMTPPRTTALLKQHSGPLLALTLLFYVPFFAVYKGVVALGVLPADAADSLFGLIGGLLAPLANGALVYLLHHAQAGVNLRFADALKASGKVFGRLLTSYIIISVIFLVWVVVPMLPALAYLGFANAKDGSVLLLAPLAIPAIYYTTRYCFIDATTVLDGLPAHAARYRSIDLAKSGRARLALNAALLMILPTALDFGGDPLAGYLEKELGVPALPVAFAAGVLSSLFYLVPLVYFYAEYRSRTAAEAARAVATPEVAAAAPPPRTAGKVLAFKKKPDDES